MIRADAGGAKFTARAAKFAAGLQLADARQREIAILDGDAVGQ